MRYEVKNNLLLSNAAYLFSARIGTMAVSFFANIYVARVLSPSGYGLINLAMTLTYYFVILSDWGLNIHGTREISRGADANSTVNSVVSAKSLLAITFFTTYVLVSYYYYTEANFLIFIVVGASLIWLPLNLDWFYQGTQNNRVVAFRQISVSVFSLVGYIVVVKDKNDAVLASLIYVCSLLFGTIWVFLVYLKENKKFLLNIDFKKTFELLKKTAFIFIATLITTTSYNVGMLVLGKYANSYNLGLYTAVYRLFTALVAPAIILFSVFFPQITKCFKQYNVKDDDYNRYLNLYSMFMFGSGFMLYFIFRKFGSNLLVFLYGNNYNEASQLINVFAFLILVHFLSYFFVYLLLMTRNDANFTKVIGIGLLFNILSLFFLFGDINISTVALSLMIGESASVLSAIILSSKLINRFVPICLCLNALTCFICDLIISHMVVFENFYLIYRLLIAFLLYFCVWCIMTLAPSYYKLKPCNSIA